jgi:hypothetical protein
MKVFDGLTWTPAQDALLRRGIADGWTLDMIAARLGTGSWDVGRRFDERALERPVVAPPRAHPNWHCGYGRAIAAKG